MQFACVNFFFRSDFLRLLGLVLRAFAMVAMRVLLLLALARVFHASLNQIFAAEQQPRRMLLLRGGSSEMSEVSEVDAIDFESALRAARLSRQSGESMDKTMAEVDVALQTGSVPFAALHMPLAGGSIATRWMSEQKVKLAVHEAVTTDGWELKPDGSRILKFSGTAWPIWLSELAAQLRTHFGGPPDECELHALEPSQSIPARQLIKDSRVLEVVACISLASGQLECWKGDDRTVVAMEPGSCVLFRDHAARELRVGVSTEERHISLTFRRKLPSS